MVVVENDDDNNNNNNILIIKEEEEKDGDGDDNDNNNHDNDNINDNNGNNVIMNNSNSNSNNENESNNNDYDGTTHNNNINPPYTNNNVSHFCNKDVHPCWLRWVIPIYLVCIFVLLLMSDLGSGIKADQILMEDTTVIQRTTLLEVSIFNSVKELWHAKSYVLTILIVVTSIVWPYVKILLSLFVWVTPFKFPKRREKFISILDVLGKWSFVDIFVLIIIMVAFRTSVVLYDDLTLEVVIIPQWGLYGFIVASILSLIGTHVILYRHRFYVLHYHCSNSKEKENTNNKTDNDDEVEEEDDEEEAVSGMIEEEEAAAVVPEVIVPSDSREQDKVEEEEEEGNDNDNNEKTHSSKSISRLLLICIIGIIIISLHVIGCFVEIYEIQRKDGHNNIIIEKESFSFISVGLKLVPYATFQNEYIGRLRFLQILYFILGFVIPIIDIMLFLILFLYKLNNNNNNSTFKRPKTNSKETSYYFLYYTEICYSWCCIEVFVISCIITVIQIPTFSNGLIESGCINCYVITSSLKPTISILIISSISHVMFCFILYKKAYNNVYNNS